jgi:hypothetical protein
MCPSTEKTLVTNKLSLAAVSMKHRMKPSIKKMCWVVSDCNKNCGSAFEETLRKLIPRMNSAPVHNVFCTDGQK